MLTPLIDGTALQKLERAKLILSDEKRWVTGWYTDGEGRYCLLGACGCNVNHFDNYLCRLVREAIQDVIPGYVGTVSTFNDHLATYAQVLLTLDKAIEIARNRSI